MWRDREKGIIILRRGGALYAAHLVRTLMDRVKNAGTYSSFSWVFGQKVSSVIASRRVLGTMPIIQLQSRRRRAQKLWQDDGRQRTFFTHTHIDVYTYKYIFIRLCWFLKKNFSRWTLRNGCGVSPETYWCKI